VNDKGAVVKGIVKEVEAKAAVITLADDVEAVLKASELSREKVEDARNILKVGDEVEAKIIAVDRKNRSINLSVKSKDVEEEKTVIKEHSAKQTEQAAPTTLGDLIKAQMQSKD
jgi:small subunit ribosomal protein S1